ncbi:rhodanese homology domain and ferritin-like domain protein [Syntrophotalea carbinolica DSM 2380]|uniref:Rhodanese homology domain and ferritin-like domain protein n=1 Tax=Syntrophotalea carbinolica (strain DSM 2380 / NBRC 103641 / GraBd1) TaxID=338963 RepID=Q3A294_SYNC1|nr:rhodanese-like domain-containing protein [Syntrophotalea carbinolica]ABA89513.1 rhodanese homology domain and ferritin-like domain protein [Syntrophotalea carbinolica DSM 2380]
MSILNYFKPVSTWSVQQVRDFLQRKSAKDYNLVDVRQPGEYEAGHLPGAILIPVRQIEERFKELDPEKPTITYCAAGVRSRAAAAALKNVGFKEVYSMSGGINAWEGLVAVNEPELGAVWFDPAHTPEDHIAMAWLLEDGTRQFYATLADTRHQAGESEFFGRMAAVEEQHKQSLMNLFSGIRGSHEDLPAAVLKERGEQTVLEGGVTLDQALKFVQGKPVQEVLELAISFESNALDRYMLLYAHMSDPKSREVFLRLADQERQHLRQLSDRLDQVLAGL